MRLCIDGVSIDQRSNFGVRWYNKNVRFCQDLILSQFTINGSSNCYLIFRESHQLIICSLIWYNKIALNHLLYAGTWCPDGGLAGSLYMTGMMHSNKKWVTWYIHHTTSVTSYRHTYIIQRQYIIHTSYNVSNIIHTSYNVSDIIHTSYTIQCCNYDKSVSITYFKYIVYNL